PPPPHLPSFPPRRSSDLTYRLRFAKTIPPKKKGGADKAPSLLRSVVQHGVGLFQPHRQANLGDVLVPPTVLVRKLDVGPERGVQDRKSTRLNSSHVKISY